MTFDNPYLLLTLLLLPGVAFLWWWLDRRPVRHAVTFTNIEVLAAVTPRRSLLRYVAPLLALLALASLCVAIARPHRTVSRASSQGTVVLVIDVSGSMQATDVKPTRLAAAQEAVRLFLKKAPKNLKVALIAFAGEPQLATPPTTDHSLVLDSLNSLGEFNGFGGTAIGDAIAAAVQLVHPQQAGGQTIAYHPVAQRRSPYSILFLSDGHQTRGDLQPLEGAARAKAAGIPVYTIALGTPNGVLTRPPDAFGGGGGGGYFGGPTSIPVPPDPVTLRQIAQTTGGKFFDARSAQAVTSAYSSLGSIIGRDRVHEEVTVSLVALGAILLVAAGLFSALVAPKLP
jgi:Ca-activated chloride channel family protein